MVEKTSSQLLVYSFYVSRNKWLFVDFSVGLIRDTPELKVKMPEDVKIQTVKKTKYAFSHANLYLTLWDIRDTIY